MRHEHHVTGRDGDVGGQTGSLGTERILDHLHDHFPPFAHQVGDLIALALLTGNIGCVQKGRPFETDIHEGRLHARQYPADTPFVDVANQSAFTGAFDDDLLHNTVLDHGYTRFRRGDVDQDFFAHEAEVYLIMRAWLSELVGV